ncbi:hypothetical protein NL676_012276 [Syzygium grande]|nr:hypothetical protein NL676_012276 [Syzygium grande]
MTLCKLRHAVAELLEKIQWVIEAAWILVLSYFIAYLEIVAISNVELRAFCSRHSNVRASGVSGKPEGCPGWADGNQQIENPVSGVSPTKETNSSKVGGKNGGDDSHKSDSTDLQEVVLSNDRSNINTKLESTDSEELGQLKKIHLSNCEDANASDSLNFVLILKKLIDR